MLGISTNLFNGVLHKALGEPLIFPNAEIKPG